MEQKMIKFNDDSVILKQGDTKREMYKILSGKVVLYLNYGEEQEYVIGVLSEQRCFGEIQILSGQPSPYTAIAINDVLCMRVVEEDFDEFIQNNPRNAIDIMKNLANNVVTLNFNLNMAVDEIANICETNKIDREKMRDITKMVRLYSATYDRRV